MAGEVFHGDGDSRNLTGERRENVLGHGFGVFTKAAVIDIGVFARADVGHEAKIHVSSRVEYQLVSISGGFLGFGDSCKAKLRGGRKRVWS